MSLSLQEALDKHTPFLENKYTKWYLSLVSKDSTADYVEKHHILPKSLFPDYAKCKWNIVKLSARQHFIAHILLYKMFKYNTEGYGKMLRALSLFKTDKRQSKYFNSKLYEEGKIQWSNFQRQKVWSEEHKAKLSATLLALKMVRGKMSEEAKQKMIASKKANFVPKIWMYKDVVQTKVVLEEIDKYLQDGWSKGTLKKHITPEWKEKMKLTALKQWSKVKETGHATKLTSYKELGIC